jgi:hypothetical protein
MPYCKTIDNKMDAYRTEMLVVDAQKQPNSATAFAWEV